MVFVSPLLLFVYLETVGTFRPKISQPLSNIYKEKIISQISKTDSDTNEISTISEHEVEASQAPGIGSFQVRPTYIKMHHYKPCLLYTSDAADE